MPRKKKELPLELERQCSKCLTFMACSATPDKIYFVCEQCEIGETVNLDDCPVLDEPELDPYESASNFAAVFGLGDARAAVKPWKAYRKYRDAQKPL